MELQNTATKQGSTKGINNKDEQKQINARTFTNNKTFSEIKIGFHNINGIKGNPYKAQELIELGQNLELDIIGITETNIRDTEGRFLKINRKNYTTYWSGAEKGKHKGSGVGILIENSWGEHLTEVKRPNSYCIKVSFRFRKAILSVWVIYIPPNDKAKQNEV